MLTDFQINAQSSSLVGFTPITEAADEWMTDNVHSEPWQWLGSTLWVDYRMAQAILDAIQDSGLTVGA